MDYFFLAILIVVLGGVLALMLHRRFTTMKAIACLVIGGGCLIGLGGSLVRLCSAPVYVATVPFLQAFSLSFLLDGLSAFFLIPIFAISMVATLYSFHYMNKPENALKTAMSYLLFALLIGAMALVVTADNMLTFMLSWEIMSLSSFFLVIYNYQSPENRKAGYLYLVFSHVGALFLFSAFGLMFSYTGSFGFEAAGSLPESIKFIVLLLFFVGFGSKAGVFPFHIWLPHAHPAAPSHISAVMSGVMIKTGIYGILRMYTHLNLQSPLFGEIVLLAGMASGILGIVYALSQQDLKRLLAFSSMENIGIILMGMGIGMIGVTSGNEFMAILGFTGCLLHVLNHAIFKSLLFMGAGMVIHKTGTRSIEALGGLMKTMRLTGITFLIGSMAISGLPLLNGFVGEFFIYFGAFKGVGLDRTAFILSHLAIVSLAIIGGLSLACFTKVLGVVFQGEARTASAQNVNEKEPAMLAPMVALAAACVVIGVCPEPFFRMALKGVSCLGPKYAPLSLAPFLELTGNITRGSALFAILFAVILVLRSVLYNDKTVTSSGTWGCGFTQPTPKMQYTGTSYAASIVGFFKPVAPLTEDHPPVEGVFPAKTHYRSTVSDIAELHMEAVIVKPILAVFDKLRWIQHGDIHLYVGYILLAIIVLLFFV